METLRKQGETQTVAEQTSVQLRGQIESRLSELRDVIVDIRTKANEEQQERRMEAQNIQVR